MISVILILIAVAGSSISSAFIITLIVVAVIALVIWCLVLYKEKSTMESLEANSDQQERLPQPTEGGYSYYELVGMQYCGLNRNDIGVHLHASAISQRDNPHDSYAVGIYNRGKLIAYIPRTDNKTLHKTIMQHYKGETEARYRIWVRNGKFYGRAYIKDEIPKKTIPPTPLEVDPNNPFYQKGVIVTGTFDMDRNELISWLEGMGAIIKKTVSSKIDIAVLGENPGLKTVSKIAELQEKGHHIKTLNEKDLDGIMAQYQ